MVNDMVLVGPFVSKVNENITDFPHVLSLSYQNDERNWREKVSKMLYRDCGYFMKWYALWFS